MARLHPLLKTGLTLLPDDKPLHLFTRHSVREMAKNGFADYRLPLTPEGVAMARQWGGELVRPVSAFYSSPVGRCVDTANAMQEGARSAGLLVAPAECETKMCLVEPGCFVHDIRKIGPEFLQLGALGFINQHFREPYAGMLSPQAGSHQLLDYFRTHQPQPGSLAVHVTHDTILAIFIAALSGRTAVSEEEWPWMMEGLWLWFDEPAGNDTWTVNWVWRGQHARYHYSTV